MYDVCTGFGKACPSFHYGWSPTPILSPLLVNTYIHTQGGQSTYGACVCTLGGDRSIDFDVISIVNASQIITALITTLTSPNGSSTVRVRASAISDIPNHQIRLVWREKNRSQHFYRVRILQMAKKRAIFSAGRQGVVQPFRRLQGGPLARSSRPSASDRSDYPQGSSRVLIRDHDSCEGKETRSPQVCAERACLPPRSWELRCEQLH